MKKSTLRFKSEKKEPIEEGKELAMPGSSSSHVLSTKRRGSFDVSALSTSSGSAGTSGKIRTRRVSMMAGEVEVRFDAGSGQILKNQAMKSPAQRSRMVGIANKNKVEPIPEVGKSKRRLSLHVDDKTGNAIVDVIDEATGENVETIETGVEPVIASKEGPLRPLLVRKFVEPHYAKTLERVETWLHQPFIQALIFLFTVIALIGDDFVRAFMPKDVDHSFHWFLTIIFFVFVIEAVILALVSVGYFGGFFFWLDLLGTFSILFDVPWFLGDSENVQDNNIEVAKAAVQLRLELGPLDSSLKASPPESYACSVFWEGTQEAAGEEEEKHNPSKIGNRLAEIISRRVVIIILLLLFITYVDD